MAQEVIAGQLGEDRVASTADGGTALTTTATLIRLPRVTDHIAITPRNFATAVVAKYHLNPWLVILKTVDTLATAPTDYSNAGQDLSAADAGVVLSSLDTLANGDFLLIGGHFPFRGCLVDVNAAHTTPNSDLAVSYSRYNTITACATSDAGAKTKITVTHGLSNDDLVTIKGTDHYDGIWTVEQVVSTTSFVINTPFVANDAKGIAFGWSNITPTDGTASGGKTFAVDGNVTWTVPSDWGKIKLSELYSADGAQVFNDNLFWTRWSVSAALDDSVTLDRLLALNRNTANYSELLAGQTFEERIRHAESGGVGCIEALTNAGTANLIVNVWTQRNSNFV